MLPLHHSPKCAEMDSNHRVPLESLGYSQVQSTALPSTLVAETGIEPARPYGHKILNLACLPKFHHSAIIVSEARFELARPRGHWPLRPARLPFHHSDISGNRNRTCTSHSAHRILSPVRLPFHHTAVMVPKVGVEPTRASAHGILNPACLPVSPLRLIGPLGFEPRVSAPQTRRLTVSLWPVKRESEMLDLKGV